MGCPWIGTFQLNIERMIQFLFSAIILTVIKYGFDYYKNIFELILIPSFAH